MENDRAEPSSEHVRGWRIFQSDQGRLWATREQPY
ncbi:MAG: hypothetical protein JWQ95_4104, partial [Sphaerisporangium sp.]|nr:hypothetical protein [Sphaerisporangium sp.]